MIEEPRAVSAGTLALGLIGAAVMQALIVAVILLPLLRRFNWPVAALITLVAVFIFDWVGVPVDAIAFGFVALAVAQPPDWIGRASLALALGGGAFAAIALLIKLNDGGGAVAIVGVGLIGLPDRRRNYALGVLAVIITLVVAWVAVGQPIGALPDYFSRGLSASEGYVDAMGSDAVGPTGQWELVVLLTAGVTLAGAAWISLAEAPRSRRLAFSACVVVLTYFTAREMFVRYDPGHANTLAFMLAVPLVMPWRRPHVAVGMTMAAGLAVASFAVLGAAGVTFEDVFNFAQKDNDLASQVSTMFSPHQTIVAAQASIRAAEGISPVIAAQLDGHCVQSEPNEVAAIFAYPGWRWCPVGALQTYAANTPELDHLDAAMYANAREGPDRVLRQAGVAIDGRFQGWQSPAAMLALLCNFKQIGLHGQWQALARIRDRCGKPRVIASIHTGANDVVSLPPPPAHSVIVAELYGLQIHHRERLETLFVRAATRTVTVNGALTFRVPPDTVTDGLIFDVPAYADVPQPFTFNLDVRTVSAAINGRAMPMTVKLLSVPIKAA
jgi:hypothetical protein